MDKHGQSLLAGVDVVPIVNVHAAHISWHHHHGQIVRFQDIQEMLPHGEDSNVVVAAAVGVAGGGRYDVVLRH